MYEWLVGEIKEIGTPKFHLVDGPNSPEALSTLREIGALLPPSYRTFLATFGGAKLYRELSYYLLGVLASPWEGKDADGAPIACIGHYDSAKAYLRLPLSEGDELPVFEWGQQGLKKVSDSFERWIELRATNCKKRVGKKKWAEIVSGPAPFTNDELRIVEARRFFRWRIVDIAPNRDLTFEVTNKSDLTLPYLSIGIRSEDRKFNGSVFLPVAFLKPGQAGRIDQDCYKDQVDPALVEAFTLPDPGPEDRDRYWEFRTR